MAVGPAAHVGEQLIVKPGGVTRSQEGREGGSVRADPVLEKLLPIGQREGRGGGALNA